MSYLNFYHLKKGPFNVTPDPEFLFLSPSHKEALGVFIYGITKRKGIIAVISEVGVGKTTVLRSYLERVDPDMQKTVYLFNSNISFADLIRTLCEELNIEVKSNNHFEMVNQIHHRLIEEYKKGKNVVLIVDEAQNMPVETLENLRMLSNLETSKDKLIQIALIGQPELEEKLNRHELRQLKQRIALRSTIFPLTNEESMDYIQHRLGKSRTKSDAIFTVAALNEIIKEARGIPRLLNILCDNALITGFGYQQKPVSVKVAREVIADFKGARPKPPFNWAVASAAAIIVLAALIWAFAFRAGLVEKSSAKSPANARKSTRTTIPPAPAQLGTQAIPTPRKSAVASDDSAAPSAARARQSEGKEDRVKQRAAKQETVKQEAEKESTKQEPTKLNATAKAAGPAVPPVAEASAPAPQPTAQKAVNKTSVVETLKPPIAVEQKSTHAVTTVSKAQAKKEAPNTRNRQEIKLAQQKQAKPEPRKATRTVSQSRAPNTPYLDHRQANNSTPADGSQSSDKAFASIGTLTNSEQRKEVASERIDQLENNTEQKEQIDETTANNNQEIAAPENNEADSAGSGSAGMDLEKKPEQPSTTRTNNQNDQKNASENDEVQLTSSVTRPQVVHSVKPVYPFAAQIRRIEGTVVLSVLVSQTGDVEAVRVLRGAATNTGLDQAAIAAVRKWKFRPAVKDGNRVRVWMALPIVFRLTR